MQFMVVSFKLLHFFSIDLSSNIVPYLLIVLWLFWVYWCLLFLWQFSCSITPRYSSCVWYTVSWTDQVYMHWWMLIRAALRTVQLMVSKGRYFAGIFLLFRFCSLLFIFFSSIFSNFHNLLDIKNLPLTIWGLHKFHNGWSNCHDAAIQKESP